MRLTRRSFPTRRSFLYAGTAGLALGAAPAVDIQHLPRSLRKLEQSISGRLGVSIVDIGSGKKTGHRADERFPFCSTFKMLLAAAILMRADEGKERLDRSLPIPRQPLLAHSPLTQPQAGGQMPISALCHAIMTQSDNTAANLLLETIGGPAGLTQFARSLGDTVTRSDRMELALNEGSPGDPRDTTSPAAMTANLQKLLLGETLSQASRTKLADWMIECKTGTNRLRAFLPSGWRAGDKTGSNGQTISNDVAIFWPVSGAPVLVSAYLAECPGPEEKRAGALAEVGRLVFEAWKKA
jgi:beta-lactamase class A